MPYLRERFSGRVIAIAIALVIAAITPAVAIAQAPALEHARGNVTAASQPETTGELEFVEIRQEVTVRITSGRDEGQEITVEAQHLNEAQAYSVGDRVVLERNPELSDEYYIRDHNRLWPITIIVAIFFVVAVIIGRRKGVGAIVGLAISIVVLAKFIVPALANGHSPVLVILGGASAITIVSFYIGHGFKRATSIALLGTLATLVVAIAMSYGAVWLAHLFGLGSEAAFYLQLNPELQLDVRGLLLAGIIVGTLGVLDDITINQVAVVRELQDANKKLSKKELYTRALRVGKDHIASLINTLALAYAGTSLPIFLAFVTSDLLPLWVIINEEYIAEELVRTFVGSTALILAVPIATIVAVTLMKPGQSLGKDPGTHHHHHHE